MRFLFLVLMLVCSVAQADPFQLRAITSKRGVGAYSYGITIEGLQTVDGPNSHRTSQPPPGGPAWDSTWGFMGRQTVFVGTSHQNGNGVHSGLARTVTTTNVDNGTKKAIQTWVDVLCTLTGSTQGNGPPTTCVTTRCDASAFSTPTYDFDQATPGNIDRPCNIIMKMVAGSPIPGITNFELECRVGNNQPGYMTAKPELNGTTWGWRVSYHTVDSNGNATISSTFDAGSLSQSRSTRAVYTPGQLVKPEVFINDADVRGNSWYNKGRKHSACSPTVTGVPQSFSINNWNCEARIQVDSLLAAP